jgi:endonuclease/exonuclease/phosphatase family metal-dependent hydrolase
LVRGRGAAALWALLLAAACPAVTTTGEDAAPYHDAGADPLTLTAVTLNTHSFQEGPDSLAKLEQIGQGLAALEADVVGLNEMMSGQFWSYDYGGASYDGTELIREALEAASGATWYVTAVGFAHWSSGELMSNVLLSRFPIVEVDSRALTTTDFWPAPDEQRNVVFARIELPARGPVNLFVTHAWGWDSVDTVTQIAEVKGFMASKARGDEVLELLLGDLNMPSTWSGHDTWLNAAPFVLVDTYALANPSGMADATTADGLHRIDYVLARASPSTVSSTRGRLCPRCPITTVW